MLNLKEIEAKILSLLELKKGWNYGEGEEIRKENAYIAIAIVRKIDDECIEGIDAAPTDYGEVNLEFNLKNGDTVGVFIDYEQDEATSYIETQYGIRDFKAVKIKGVAGHIQEEITKCKNRVTCRITNSYMQGLYTKCISEVIKKLKSPKYSDLSAKVINLSEVYLSSMLNVQQAETEACAGMSELSEKHIVASGIHVFSGSLTPSYYPMSAK